MGLNPHSTLVNNLLVALGARPDLGKFWKRNTGAFQTDQGHYIKYGLVGAADIEGLLVTGRHVEIECKTGAGKQSEAQCNFEAMILRFHGVYILARSVQPVITYLEQAACRQS